ncbi:hypothetical protein ACHAXS_009092 [Conticribra weissflogii]
MTHDHTPNVVTVINMAPPSESKQSPPRPRFRRRRRLPARRLPSSQTPTKTTRLLLLLTPQLILDSTLRQTHQPFLPFPPLHLPTASASGILADLTAHLTEKLFPEDEFLYDEDVDLETKTLSMLEISDMRARDIKRRLARSHGYGADELAKMIDKADLINALSFEEHKVYVQEVEKRKWRRWKRGMVGTCAAVLVVLFWPVLRHVWEVACVNFVVYTVTSNIFLQFTLAQCKKLKTKSTHDNKSASLPNDRSPSDRRRHEISRCREFHSYKGYFGILLLFLIDLLSLWLSTSVLLSWVMTSKYFFPTPSIPIRPVELLTPKGHSSGEFGKYGINIGPMLISWGLRFLNGQVEGMIGRAMAEAFQEQRRKEKEEMKKRRKEEKAKEKEERREARRAAKLREEEERKRREEGMEMTQSNEGDLDGHTHNLSHGGFDNNTEQNTMKGSTWNDLDLPTDGDIGVSSNFDDLD